MPVTVRNVDSALASSAGAGTLILAMLIGHGSPL
jgi:hypothetical protein